MSVVTLAVRKPEFTSNVPKGAGSDCSSPSAVSRWHQAPYGPRVSAPLWLPRTGGRTTVMLQSLLLGAFEIDGIEGLGAQHEHPFTRRRGSRGSVICCRLLHDLRHLGERRGGAETHRASARTLAVMKTYTLLDEDGRPYESDFPGTLGGARRSKIYGRLDCPSALRAIAEGGYVQHRVFFADEEVAIAAGYRPCGSCLRSKYRLWLADSEARKVIRGT